MTPMMAPFRCVSVSGRVLLTWTDPHVHCDQLEPALADHRWRRRRGDRPGVIVDFRAARLSLDMTASRGLARRLATRFPNAGPIAILVQDLLSHGIARQFGMFAAIHGWEVAVFRSIDEADHWLAEVEVRDGEDRGGVVTAINRFVAARSFA